MGPRAAAALPFSPDRRAGRERAERAAARELRVRALEPAALGGPGRAGPRPGGERLGGGRAGRAGAPVRSRFVRPAVPPRPSAPPLAARPLLHARGRPGAGPARRNGPLRPRRPFFPRPRSGPPPAGSRLGGGVAPARDRPASGSAGFGALTVDFMPPLRPAPCPPARGCVRVLARVSLGVQSGVGGRFPSVPRDGGAFDVFLPTTSLQFPRPVPDSEFIALCARVKLGFWRERGVCICVPVRLSPSDELPESFGSRAWFCDYKKKKCVVPGSKDQSVLGRMGSPRLRSVVRYFTSASLLPPIWFPLHFRAC